MQTLIERLEQKQIGRDFVKEVRAATKSIFAAKPKSAKEGIEALVKAEHFVQDLAKDLAYGKGFFQFMPKGKTRLQGMTALRDKVMSTLREVSDQLFDTRTLLELNTKLAEVGSAEFKKNKGAFRKRLEQVAGGKDPDAFFESFAAGHARDALETAYKALSTKMFAALTKAISEGQALQVDEIPREVSLGNAKLIFDDRPDSTKYAVQGVWERDPRAWKGYVREAERAKALLAAKGLSFLWYGPMIVQPYTAGTVKKPGGKSFQAAAAYGLRNDQVRIYQQSPGLGETIAHELGHRLWFKFMSAGDRARFASWFGEVPANSAYGSTHPEEDFAEVFRAYVDGNSLTREQVERFKAFVRVKGKKLRESEDRLAALVERLSAE